MFEFLKKFLNKRRAQKLNARIAKLETAFTLFQIVEAEDIKTEKLVQRLSKEAYIQLAECLEMPLTDVEILVFENFRKALTL